MVGSPLAHPLDVGGAAEMVLIFRLAQPPVLALGLAGFPAVGLATKLLVMMVARMRSEQLFALHTLALRTFGHPAF